LAAVVAKPETGLEPAALALHERRSTN